MVTHAAPPAPQPPEHRENRATYPVIYSSRHENFDFVKTIFVNDKVHFFGVAAPMRVRVFAIKVFLEKRRVFLKRHRETLRHIRRGIHRLRIIIDIPARIREVVRHIETRLVTEFRQRKDYLFQDRHARIMDVIVRPNFSAQLLNKPNSFFANGGVIERANLLARYRYGFQFTHFTIDPIICVSYQSFVM